MVYWKNPCEWNWKDQHRPTSFVSIKQRNPKLGAKGSTPIIKTDRTKQGNGNFTLHARSIETMVRCIWTFQHVHAAAQYNYSVLALDQVSFSWIAWAYFVLASVEIHHQFPGNEIGTKVGELSPMVTAGAIQQAECKKPTWSIKYVA
jgi:hypothetical protein